jgi:hypothetical protein
MCWMAFMARLAENCAAKTRFKKTMPDLWTNLGKDETTHWRL